MTSLRLARLADASGRAGARYCGWRSTAVTSVDHLSLSNALWGLDMKIVLLTLAITDKLFAPCRILRRARGRRIFRPSSRLQCRDCRGLHEWRFVTATCVPEALQSIISLAACTAPDAEFRSVRSEHLRQAPESGAPSRANELLSLFFRAGPALLRSFGRGSPFCMSLFSQRLRECRKIQGVGFDHTLTDL
jgi:hypothetical protein